MTQPHHAVIEKGAERGLDFLLVNLEGRRLCDRADDVDLAVVQLMAARGLGFAHHRSRQLHHRALDAAAQRRQLSRRQHGLKQAKPIAQHQKIDGADLT